MRCYKTGVNGVVHFAELVNTYIRSSFYLRVLKRLHSATIVELKRNVTFIMTGTVYMYIYGYIMYTAWALNRVLFHKRCGLNILFATI